MDRQFVFIVFGPTQFNLYDIIHTFVTISKKKQIY